MRSSPDFRAVWLSFVLVVMPPAFAASGDEPVARQVTDEEVRHALSEVMQDPDLGRQETIRRLHWVDPSGQRESSPSPLFPWLRNAVAWLGGITRWIFWLFVAAVVGVIAVLALRLGRLDRKAPARETPRAAPSPTHVRDLDIRPEKLPHDIGSAALTLWHQGEHDAALALLYRGSLSRLVHRYALPIQPSSTEAECAAMAGRALAAPQARFVQTLLSCWVQGVYGGQRTDAAIILELCTGFAPLLDEGSLQPWPASRQ